MAQTYLEPKFAPAYTAWQQRPTPQTTAELLRTVQPVIDKSLQAFAGDDNPLLRSRARQIALRALQTYDPTKSALTTHLTNHLQGIRRAVRTQQQVVRIPERVSLDAWRVAQAKQEFFEEEGRDPSDVELADRTGLSIRRLQRLRGLRMPIASGTLEAMTADEESASWQPGVTGPDSSTQQKAAIELVYGDVDNTSRLIMEYGLGLHGRKPLSNMEIAKKLKMTPSAVSQRKAVLQKKIDEAMTSGLL